MPEDLNQQIVRLLQLRGLTSSGELTTALGISRATLARQLAKIEKLVTIGNTRDLRYGLLRDIPDLASELPLFRIDGQGHMIPATKLSILHQNYYIAGMETYAGSPPEIADMAPQGFMGRAFAKKYATELNLPSRLADWSDDHFLKAIARRGEDLQGNLIVGKESAERWQQITFTNEKKSSFVDHAKEALEEQPTGSSAGGERPKFSVVMNNEHFIVKFAGPLKLAAQKRWRDLLICESKAAKLLAQNDIPSAEAEFWESTDFAFLIIKRFDRIGKKGRGPVITFAGIDDYFYGKRDDWSKTAERLRRDNMLSDKDVETIKLVDTFAQCIGDSDRHFYNMALVPKFKASTSLLPQNFELAPMFDKLPMIFAPIETHIVERQLITPLPDAHLVDVWSEGKKLAQEFWNQISQDKSLSADFRSIAKKCQNELS